jgi:hypothetical protein
MPKPKEAIQMIEYYTLKQARDLLGFQSTNAFLQLVRKYPEIFANINPNTQKNRYIWYDKEAVDKFIQIRERFKQEKP